MKQARCQGEQPILCGASIALKYCDSNILGDRKGRCFFWAVFALILGKPTEQLPPNRSYSPAQYCINLQILHQELHFIRREAASKQAARCRCPAVYLKYLHVCVAMVLQCDGNWVQLLNMLLYNVRYVSRVFGFWLSMSYVSAFHPILLMAEILHQFIGSLSQDV